MSGPLPPVSSLTTAILLNVLNGSDIGGNPRQPYTGANNPSATPPGKQDNTPSNAATGNSAEQSGRSLSAQGSDSTARTSATAATAPTASTAHPSPTTITASPLMQETARQLRQALPAQQPLPATLVKLWQWFRDASLPADLAPLRAQVREAVARMPTRERLSQPEGLRDALRNSGLFSTTEETSTAVRPDDLRQVLNRLSTAFRQQANQAAVPGDAASPAKSAPEEPQASSTRQTTGQPVPENRPDAGAETNSLASSTPRGALPAAAPALPQPSATPAETVPSRQTGTQPQAAPQTVDGGHKPAPAVAETPGQNAQASTLPADKSLPAQVSDALSARLAPAEAKSAPPATAGSDNRDTQSANTGRETTGHRNTGNDGRVSAYLTPQNTGDDSAPGRLQPQPRQTLPDLQTAWHQTALGDMADLLQGNLARLDAHQLQSLQQREQGQPQWLMELPVRDHDGLDLWQVHVQRDPDGRRPGSPRDADSTWQVTLSFCFERSGPMVARLRLQGDNLQVTFHSEQADTASWLQRHAGTLTASLQAAGLAQVKVNQVSGLPHPDTLPAMTPATGLKVRA